MFDQLGDVEKNWRYLSKGDYVYQVLKEKIVNGYLERNKVYTTVEIAEKLGVSRTPVGEAVKILGSQNYIILYPGVGFKVKELTIEDVHENLIISGALEEALLRKIIQRGVAPTGKLKEAVEHSRKAIVERTPELYTRASADFHKAFYALSGLPRVIEVLRENVFVHEVWYREGAGRFPELTRRLVADHANIVDLIQRGDYGGITEVISCHVENCTNVLTQVISAEKERI